MKKKAHIRSVTGLPNKAEKKPRSAKDPLQDLSEQDVRSLAKKLTGQNKKLLKAQQEIETSRQQYADLYDFAPVGYLTLDRKGIVREANLTAASLLGVERSRLSGKPLSPYISQSSRNIFRLHNKEVFETGGPQACEIELRRKDGTVFFAAFESVSACGETLRTAINNITKRKKEEEELKESEERYRGIFEGANDGIIAYDLKTGKFLFVNKRMSELTGHSGKEILKLGVKDLHPEKDVPSVLKEFDAIASGKKTGAKDIPVLKKDGSVIYCDIGSSFIGKTTLLGFFRDVTDRKQAEEALHRAHVELESRVQDRTRELEEANKTINTEKQRFYDVLEMLPAYVVLLTPDYYVPFANRFFRERFGDSGGRRCYEYLFERTEPCEICETYSVLKTNTTHHWEWTGPDGRNYDIFDFPFTDLDGSPLIMEVGIDITERKQAEEGLRKVNETLEQRVAERTEELRTNNEELTRFNTVAVGRELHMIELKKEINKLCIRAGQPPRYPLDFEEEQ